MKTQAYRLGALFVAVVVMAVMLPMTALAIPSGTYQLGSHPGGSEKPPLYGMRLDNLNSSGEVWTFDFDHAGSSMQMTVVQGTSVRIFGTVVGAVDDDNLVTPGWDLATQTTFAMDFTYNLTNNLNPVDSTTITESVNGGVDDTLVSQVDNSVANHNDDLNLNALSTVGGSADGTTIVAGTSFDLRAHEGNNGASLQLGDEGGAGHRGFSGISGWGWLDHRVNGGPDPFTDSPSDAGCCSDLLFTVVPEPASMILFGSGLLGLAAWRRFRKTV